MRNYLCVWGFVSLLICLLAPRSSALTDVYNYQVYGVKLKNTPNVKLDGKLDDKIWQDIPAMGEFHFVKNIDDKTEERQTLAKVFYTKHAIYLGIECLETSVDEIQKKIMSENIQTYWSDDCIEVYLESGRTYKKFYKLAVNPNGVLWAMKTRGGESDSTWKERSQIRTLASVSRCGWSLEIIIPYDGLSKAPSPGDLWVFNIRRLRWGKKRQIEDSSWSPGASYYNSWRFGHIYFLGADGQYGIDKLIELSREKKGAIVEVMAGKGRMFLQANEGIVDKELDSLDKTLKEANEMLKNQAISEKPPHMLFERYNRVREKYDHLRKLRGDGALSSAKMSRIFLPLKELKYEAEAIVWDEKWLIMKNNSKEIE